MQHAGVRRGHSEILVGIDWTILPGQNWLVLGPNGSGKTTLLSLAGATAHPTSGTVEVLGRRLGSSDLRSLRARIGIASPALARELRSDMTAEEVVLSGFQGALETWWHDYSYHERSLARAALARAGLAGRADHELRTLSSGELRKVQIARALAPDPEFLLLDEPASGLDLGSREELLARLATLLTSGPPVVMVTHHLEEIPPGITHLLMLSAGRVTCQGPLEVCLTDRSLSECFGLDLAVHRIGDRWSCSAR